MTGFFRKLASFVQKGRKETELREELEFHLAEEVDERQTAGMPPADAQTAARRDLGNLGRVQEETRAAWGWTLAEQLAQDLRYAWRTMSANRLFTALAVMSLALGIGANTAIFSFMDAILLRALPVSDPGKLVVLNWHAKSERDFVMHGMSGTTYDDPSGVTSGIFPYPAFELLRTYDGIFSSVFGHFRSRDARSLNVAVKGQAGIAGGVLVTGDYFRGLGVPPAAGRLISPDDDRPGAPAVAVVSSALSQRRFGGDATGQSITVDNLPFTVIGVAPPDFFGADPSVIPDIYLPLHTTEALGAGNQFHFEAGDYLDSNFYWLNVMGRLRPGVTPAQAKAVLAPVFHQWVAATATSDPERANLPELRIDEGAGGMDTLRREYSRPLYVLMTLVGLILALACANVANLLLARAASRRREIALRLSVGASRGRVIRQLLTESVLLASLGGLLGVLIAIWGTRLLTTLLGNGRENFTLHAQLNWHVLAVAAALSLATGVLFGLAPALQATRGDVMPALKETRAGQPQTHLLRRFSLSSLLIVSQIAISLLMLVAAGLFVRTLTNLHSIVLGFNRDNVLLFRLDARKAGHQDPEISTFYAELRRRFAALPGVRNASLSEDSLIEAGTALPLGVAGQPVGRGNRLLTVGPAFFSTMQIPMLAGRDLNDRDRANSPAVTVINEAFAKISFPGQNPIGQHLTLGEGRQEPRRARDMEIVGVCRNARYGGLTRKIPPVAYILYDQGFPRPDQMVYELRTEGDPMRYVDAVREVVRRADSHVPVYEVRTQRTDIDQTINQEITFAALCSGFAILALVIACVGLYGTVSYSVARRTGEIGIRMALGAPRGSVMRMILRDVLLLSAAGLAIGMAVALATSKFVASFLYETKPNDPLSLLVAVVVLLAAATLAGYAPARRASRIDPMAALRHE